MPPAIKRAVVREVARRESNLNDVAVALLAERFGIPFSPSGRRRKAIPGAAGAVVLRMPPELRRELKAAARRRKLNVNDLVLVTLSDALEIPFTSNRKDTMASTNGSSNGSTTVRHAGRTRSASRSSASATARTPSFRACSTTRTRPTTSSSPA